MKNIKIILPLIYFLLVMASLYLTEKICFIFFSLDIVENQNVFYIYLILIISIFLFAFSVYKFFSLLLKGINRKNLVEIISGSLFIVITTFVFVVIMSLFNSTFTNWSGGEFYQDYGRYKKIAPCYYKWEPGTNSNLNDLPCMPGPNEDCN